MSNTYFEIKKIDDKISGMPQESIDMELSLTAFMGGDRTIQLTVQHKRKGNPKPRLDESGCSYITLTNQEQDMLIAAIMERRLGKVTATNEVKSDYSPSTD